MPPEPIAALSSSDCALITADLIERVKRGTRARFRKIDEAHDTVEMSGDRYDEMMETLHRIVTEAER